MTAARDWRGLLFVAPFVLLYAIILIYPLLRGLWLSFNQVDLFGDGHFVGFGNYARLAQDPIFATAMVNTFVVTLMIVPLLTAIALALAVALNNAGRGAAPQLPAVPTGPNIQESRGTVAPAATATAASCHRLPRSCTSALSLSPSYGFSSRRQPARATYSAAEPIRSSGRLASPSRTSPPPSSCDSMRVIVPK